MQRVDALILTIVGGAFGEAGTCGRSEGIRAGEYFLRARDGLRGGNAHHCQRGCIVGGGRSYETLLSFARAACENSQ